MRWTSDLIEPASQLSNGGATDWSCESAVSLTARLWPASNDGPRGGSVNRDSLFHRVDRSKKALERASRMLDDLKGRSVSVVAFRERIPYVLDPLAGVTRVVSKATKGHRTQALAYWWSTADRSSQ